MPAMIIKKNRDLNPLKSRPEKENIYFYRKLDLVFSR